MASISVDRALTIARNAVARLAALVRPDGQFVYRYELGAAPPSTDIYGNIRHIAAVWTLVDAEREGWAIDGLSAVIDRAAAFMEERIFRPYGSSGTLCVLDEGLIKLGGSALGVAAEIGLFKRPGGASGAAGLDRIRRLAGYVAAQRQGNGDFLQVRVPAALPKPHPGHDDLTAGQAILALALAAEATGDASFLALAVDSARRFAVRDEGVGTLAHWMLYGLEAVDRVEPRDEWLAYAARLAEGIIALSVPDQSTPIACATEGLLAYARTLRRRGDQERSVARLLAEAEARLVKQLRFYHPSGAFFASAADRLVRIDFIAHNVLGFLGYARLVQGR